jgi:hypothetical protein
MNDPMTKPTAAMNPITAAARSTVLGAPTGGGVLA